MRAGYFGPEGTNTQEALLADTAGLELEMVPLPTIYDTVMAVHEGLVDQALVPIENSMEGSVNATLDALAMETDDVAIVGEVVHPISHCLIARTALELSEIETVVSHPQANAQCARFIRTRLPGAPCSPAPPPPTRCGRSPATMAPGRHSATGWLPSATAAWCCAPVSRTSRATRPGSCGWPGPGRPPAGRGSRSETR